MTNKELNIVVTSVVKAIGSQIPVLVRRIVREELELNNSMGKSFVSEQTSFTPKRQQPQKQVKRKVTENDLSRLFEGGDISNIFSETKSKVKMPTTGINLLDEYLEQAPTEDELIRQSQRSTSVNTGMKPMPIEQLYENDIKTVSVDDALNIDYSGFLNMMNNASAEKGSHIPMGVNPSAMYVKDPSLVLQEQSVGTPRVEKQYKA